MTDRTQLTGAQRLMLAGQNLSPDDPLYNSAFLFVIHDSIEVPSFIEAFSRLIADAEVFRTVIINPTGDASQVVLDTLKFDLPVLDFVEHSDPDAAAMEWANRQAKQPFDIESATFDAALLRIAENRFALYLNQHHMVTDARSVEVLFRHLEQLYLAIESDSREPIDPIPSFSGYVEYEAASAAKRNIQAGISVVPASLYGHPVRADGTDNARLEVELSRELSEELRQLIDRPGNGALTRDLALFQVFTTATFALLRRIGGQETITIVSPAHNRVSRDFAASAGLFIELFPIEVTIDADETFASLHKRVQDATLDYLRRAQPGRSDPDVNRRVNVVLNYLTSDFSSFAGRPVKTRWLHPDSTDQHHQLRVQVHDFDRSGRFTLAFDVATSALNDRERASLAAQFETVLDAMVRGWDQPIDEVDLLNDDERREVLALAAGGTSTKELNDVVAMFLDRAAEMPGSVAIRDGDTTWTYADVADASARLAGSIEPRSVIGIAIPRSAGAVVAMLGVLRAGAAYVPIDPSWPLERIRYVAASANCSKIVAAGPIDVEAAVVTFDELLSAAPQALQAASAAADHLAYVLYTSGSTGEPKGVMIERSSLANYVSWATDFYGHGLTFPLFTPLTFDLTITSIFVPLTSGGSIVTYPSTTASADLAVLEVFADDAVDIVKLTPSHLALLADGDMAGSRIAQLIVGGEDFPTSAAKRVHASFGGNVRIHNEYGPTEATVGCIVHTFDPTRDHDASVPIGRPITNMRAYVVDSAGHPVPMSVPGELWLAGAGLARGYAGRPDLTDARFRWSDSLDKQTLYATGDLGRLRPDGTIEYLGRRDDQVKIKGIRAELGEIESALASYPGVTASAARIWEQADPTPPENLIHCARCGLASDYPGVSFDADRVCSECRAFDDYGVKARVYFKPEADLEAILTSQRSTRGEYDCISLLSGGKDSSYVLCRLVDLGLNVLAITLDNGYLSDQAKGNIARVVDALGVDHRFVSTPAMNEIFVDSLQRHSNVCNGCFKTIYTLGMQTALDEDIPYIVTGLSRGQFFETRLTAELFTELSVSSDAIDANVLEARKAYHQVDDAVHRLLDVSMFDDDGVFEAVQFVDFYRFVDVSLDELYEYLEERVPWVRPTDTGRSTNCLINDVGIYYHRKTRGFHNYALPYSWDVRMGHKTRDAALEELDDSIDVAAVARMLDEIGFPDDVTGSDSGRSLVSYYVAPVEIPVPQLREHMATTLPRQLLPSRVVRLDALPLTANGKVDRGQLPAADTHRPDMEEAYVAAQSDAEILLARIWEQVLGVEGIGIRDNYFDLGGDSITAVQIIARAHRFGLPITMNQLAEELTIENLAAASARSSAPRAERLIGSVGLTPIQEWFFEEVEDPSHFHHVVRVGRHGGVDVGSLVEALAVLTDHHDALRQSFRETDEGWVSSIEESVPAISLEIAEAGDSPNDSELTAPFDLAQAPLMRASLRHSADGSAELVVVAHHLIVDGVSWSHFIDDLGYLTNSEIGETSVLPSVTSSINDWMDLLRAAASTIEVEPWQSAARTDAAAWPATSTASEERGVERVDRGTTGALLARAADLGMGLDELLIATVAAELQKTSPSPRVRLFLEGHGRESDSSGVDITRTMGWFTSLYPAVLEPPDDMASVEAIHAIRDQIRTATRHGGDYGVVRYLHPDPDVRASVTLTHRDHLVVNYLGRLGHSQRADDEPPFALAGPFQLHRPPERNRIFGGEIMAYIADDALAVEWTTGQSSAALLQDVVRAAVHAMLSLEADGAHASEAFSLAGLDDHAMGKLAAALETADEEAAP